MTSTSSLRSALKTLSVEQAGLSALHDALQGPLCDAFVEACKIMGDIKGRVIVTGVGKSGHIGAKIAATLASTGTPAFFVHPSEANHGDLGMIARDDAILALSWSGETTELRGTIAYSQRFSIPLIAITSSETSTLASHADVVLALPKEKEACPHNLAPTTSSLMTLAMGDALAIALLEGREFTADNFGVFHPGGQLGAKLMHVRDLMHTGEEVPIVQTGTLMTDAILQISQKGFGCVGVTNKNGDLIGIITDGDLARHLSPNLLSERVDDIMTRDPKTVLPDELAAAALEFINKKSISALMVTEGPKPVGIIHLHDLLRVGVA
ncbi:SIS domain-containing protein [Pseudahrensia aquimaris]|uniref:SIS domain-containing protein n=1 Tax=Pseudahrensia aquimaris TaxID=744461 RepID=A0ABW3FCC8_9HYPH